MRRLLLGAAVVVVLSVGATAPADAHVTVNPREAEQGGFTKLAFRVPNERDDARTTKVDIAFPTEHPIENVSVRPHPGWTVDVQRAGPGADQPVTRITWAASSDETAIDVGEFDEFEVSVGPLPEGVDELFFPALQTYSSGEVVRWLDEPIEEGEELEHPAPRLALVSASAPEEAEAAPAEGDDTDDGDGGPLVIISLVLSGAALLLAGAAIGRRT